MAVRELEEQEPRAIRPKKLSRPILPPLDPTLQVDLQTGSQRALVEDHQREFGKGVEANTDFEHEREKEKLQRSNLNASVNLPSTSSSSDAQARAREDFLHQNGRQVSNSPAGIIAELPSARLTHSPTEASRISAPTSVASRVLETGVAVGDVFGDLVRASLTGGKNLVVGSFWGIVHAGAWLANFDHLASIWRGTCNIATTIGDMFKLVFSKNTLELGASAVNFVWDLIKNPASWKVAGSLAIFGLKKLAQFGLELLEHPDRALGFIWSGAKFLYESSGLKDILMGAGQLIRSPITFAKGLLGTAWNFSTDLFKVLTGKLSPAELGRNLEKNLKGTLSDTLSDIGGALRMLKGGVMALGQLTGITDLILCIKALAQGDKKMALIYGISAALSIGTIVATIATAGGLASSVAAWALIRQGGKAAFVAAAKETFLVAGKRMGTILIGDLMKEELSSTALKKLSSTVVEDLSKRAGKTVLKDGLHALNQEGLHAIGKKIAEKDILRYLRHDLFKSGVDKHIEKLTTDLLTHIDGLKGKKLVQYFQEMGFEDPKIAKRMAERTAAVLKYGKRDKELKEALMDGICQELVPHLKAEMREPCMKALAKNLRGEGESFESRAMAASALQTAFDRVKIGLREGDPLLAQIAKYEKVLSEPTTYWRATHIIKELGELEDKRLLHTFNEVVEDWSRAAWEGIEEGIEKAVGRLAKKGVDKGFKNFRNGQRKLFKHSADNDQMQDLPAVTFVNGQEKKLPEIRRTPESTIFRFDLGALDRIDCETKHVLNGVDMVFKKIHPDGTFEVLKSLHYDENFAASTLRLRNEAIKVFNDLKKAA